MKQFIWKTFVKGHEDTRDPEVRRRYTRLTGVLGIIVNALLCGAKIVLGLLSGSIAVIADGLHDMADSLAACITLIGAHIAGKPADRKHPYGHARAEYLASLVISAVVLVVGWELLCTSVDRCFHPTLSEFSWTMVIFMLAAILIKGSSALFTIATGKHIRSLPVIAAGTDNRNDVITSIIIVIGMLLHRFAGLQLDGPMGCIVSLFILWSGISLIRETIDPLLGEPPDQDTIDEIRRIVLSYPQILGMHDLIIYNYGPGKSFASFHAEVDSRERLTDVHDIIDEIERKLTDQLNIVVTGHMDPVEVDNPIRIRMQRLVEDQISKYDGLEEAHDLRIVSGKERTKVVFDLVVSPDLIMSEDTVRDLMDQAVKAEDPACETAINFEKALI
ncbi:MAG: cation transporter [Firmicutes bacterium]|nr:cation transporter [Bacillota bacterium]